MLAQYFSAPWCGPCKTFKPVFKRVADELDIPYDEYDLDVEPDYASDMKVMSVPTVILFKQGIEVDRIVGAFPEPRLRERLAGLVG